MRHIYRLTFLLILIGFYFIPSASCYEETIVIDSSWSDRYAEFFRIYDKVQIDYSCNVSNGMSVILTDSAHALDFTFSFFYYRTSAVSSGSYLFDVPKDDTFHFVMFNAIGDPIEVHYKIEKSILTYWYIFLIVGIVAIIGVVYYRKRGKTRVKDRIQLREREKEMREREKEVKRIEEIKNLPRREDGPIDPHKGDPHRLDFLRKEETHYEYDPQKFDFLREEENPNKKTTKKVE